MILKKLLPLFVISLFQYHMAEAQHPDFKKEWKKIDSLEQKGLYSSAREVSLQIFNEANAKNNEAQQIKAGLFLMKYRNFIEEESGINNYFYLDTIIAKTKSPASNILLSVQAEMLQYYRDQNRWRFYNRTELAEENSKDIATWSLELLQQTITKKYLASLENETLLKNTGLDKYAVIIDKGKNTEGLRPTIYDLLAHRALDFFMNAENTVTNPAYKFIINDEKYFAAADQFVQLNIKSEDSTSLYYQALKLFQELFRFHLADKNKAALADADLKRLAFVYEHGVFTNKDELYDAALLQLENEFSGTEQSAEAAFLRAQLVFQKTDNESRHDSLLKNDRIKARQMAMAISSKYPKTNAAAKAKNLINNIEEKTLQLSAEEVNTINDPFRVLVTYKNIDKLYLRVYKTTRDFVKDNNRSWEEVLQKKFLKNWEQVVPGSNDHYTHSAEIKVDGLPSGLYYVVASVNKDFKKDNNLVAFQLTSVSNISEIMHNSNEIFIVDRNTGQPLENASITLWEEFYNSSKRKSDQKMVSTVNTNENGFAKLEASPNSRSVSLQIKYKDDELFQLDNVYLYNYYNNNNDRATTQTFLFTDRSIYRPGQKVFFKGIMVQTGKGRRNNEVLKNKKTTIILYDANGQKQRSLVVTTNDYGSYNGSFDLPEGQLNGQFHITDSVTNSSKYFSVEEYKRPKFSVEIKQPEGSYRVNDSITVKGNAKAFAGNNIDGAKLTYRVVRKVRYPWWWGWRMPNRSTEEMEITNGAAVTDASGDFTIVFKAIPDESIDKKAQPTFTYEVSADVTDLNGETHSGTTNVSVKYQALDLDIVSANKLEADSLQKIKINSTNTNGVFEQTKVTLTIDKLVSNNQVYRSRYWEKPDQFVMSREAYTASFPYDEYKDESNMQTWAVEKTFATITDTTTKTGDWNFKGLKLPAGWYRLTATTIDKYGEPVKDIVYVQLTKKEENVNVPFAVDENKKVLEPGETLAYDYKTGFKKIWVIEELKKTEGEGSLNFIDIKQGDAYKNSIKINEKDRGGVMLSQSFVQHNRFYNYNQLYNVPWTNKELKIDYSTFRDNILPGSKENWSIQISGDKKDAVAAEALISMYDASLDELKPQSWNSLQSLWPGLNRNNRWFSNSFQQKGSQESDDLARKYLNIEPVVYPSLMSLNYEINQVKFASPRIVSDGNVRAELEEVVVTGMNVDRALQGKAAGLNITQQDQEVSEKAKEPTQKPVSPTIQIRKNFNETAFFFPDLKTDAKGNISFSFTIPEALTKWKMMTLAHTQGLASAYSEKTLVTQKPLMVQPNAPRFLREGDAMEFSAKIVNLTDKEITGTSALQLFDATTDTPVDGLFNNIFPNQYFTVAAGQSVAVKFPIAIPINFNSALSYRITAQSATKDSSGNTFSDGEQAALPVLTNRTLVTETLPLNVRNTNSKTFTFDKLLNSEKNSATLTHHALTVEYTSNPAWYAVQALPYLMEYPYECSEQTFNKFYANTLASWVANSTPRLKTVFDKWAAGGKDSAALLSNLQKNEELKSALLQETPWVLQAKNEAEQKKNIGILFNMSRLASEKKSTYNKLKEMQLGNGGFSWFKGGRDDRYITQYIITGIGHLKKLNALTSTDNDQLRDIVNKALPYLDNRLTDEYNDLLKYKVKLADNHLSSIAAQYLYMRSFFPETAITAANKKAYDYFYGQAQKYWLQNNKYTQAMIALAMHRAQDEKTAKAIIASLKETAIYKEEMGMYWKDYTSGGYYWYQAPIETHAMLIEAFTDIDQNVATINDLKTWLLKQKQTQNWRTTKATAEACYALLMNGNDWLAEERNVTITLGNSIVIKSDESAEAGTGYFKKRIDGEKVEPGMGRIKVDIEATATAPPAPQGGRKSPPAPQGGSKNSNVDVNSNQSGTSSTPPLRRVGGAVGSGFGAPSWGAIYWQYFEELDKVTSAETPLKLQKKLFIEKNTDRGPVLTAVNDGDELRIGDKLKVRIELRVDRDMEYVHMKDMRAAATEPVNVISSYKYQDGLGYYESTKDASTNFFFSWLPKGTYVFEYPLFVTHAGNFSNGITTIQCMYAPEFSSHSEGVRIEVK